MPGGRGKRESMRYSSVQHGMLLVDDDSALGYGDDGAGGGVDHERLNLS